MKENALSIFSFLFPAPLWIRPIADLSVEALTLNVHTLYLCRIEVSENRTEVTTLFSDVKKSFIGVGVSIDRIIIGVTWIVSMADSISFSIDIPINVLRTQIGSEDFSGLNEPILMISGTSSPLRIRDIE
jgi:hypothetical protein